MPGARMEELAQLEVAAGAADRSTMGERPPGALPLVTADRLGVDMPARAGEVQHALVYGRRLEDRHPVESVTVCAQVRTMACWIGCSPRCQASEAAMALS